MNFFNPAQSLPEATQESGMTFVLQSIPLLLKVKTLGYKLGTFQVYKDGTKMKGGHFRIAGCSGDWDNKVEGWSYIQETPVLDTIPKLVKQIVELKTKEGTTPLEAYKSLDWMFSSLDNLSIRLQVVKSISISSPKTASKTLEGSDLTAEKVLEMLSTTSYSCYEVNLKNRGYYTQTTSSTSFSGYTQAQPIVDLLHMFSS